MSQPVAIVGVRVTKEAAAERGLVPHGHVWDEATQQAVPLGQAVAMDAERRDEDPAVQLQRFDQRRTALLGFVRTKMQEAEYDKKSGRPLDGKLHHYYVVPGSKKKALTKLGAELLGDLYRYRRAEAPVTHRVETREYCSASVHCVLVDSWGAVAGAHEAACSTAEVGFRSPGQRQKYGAVGRWEGPRGDSEWVETEPPDYRAALNEIITRAGKRAYVGAMIVACAADEIFELGSVVDAGERGDQHDGASAKPKGGGSVQNKPERARPAARTLTVGGKPFSALSTAELERALARAREMGKVSHVDALSEELERRRELDEFPAVLDEDEEDDLPIAG